MCRQGNARSQVSFTASPARCALHPAYAEHGAQLDIDAQCGAWRRLSALLLEWPWTPVKALLSAVAANHDA
jgi:hypothetical protein